MEIDGRRVSLGLPAELLRGMLTPQSSADGAPAGPAETTEDSDAVASPIAGTLQSWSVADGSEVNKGDVIAVMEAMKMELQVTAHRTGRITLKARAGSYQSAGASLASIE